MGVDGSGGERVGDVTDPSVIFIIVKEKILDLKQLSKHCSQMSAVHKRKTNSRVLRLIRRCTPQQQRNAYAKLLSFRVVRTALALGSN